MANERFAEFIEQDPKSFVQGLFEESSTQKQRLGTIRKLSDGREFVYAQMGAANAVAGAVYQGVAPVVANHANMAVTANAAVGAREVSITMGDSTLANTANALAEGFLWVNTGAGNGCAYKIKSHAAIAANANGNIALYDKVRIALTAATSKVSVMQHPCKAVIIHPSPPTGAIVGVAPQVITANYFAWLQRRGPCAVEVEGTVVNGDSVICSETVDGTVGPGANGASEEEYPVGVCIANSANDHWALIDLKL